MVGLSPECRIGENGPVSIGGGTMPDVAKSRSDAGSSPDCADRRCRRSESSREDAMKICPSCGEQVQDTAVKCWHCHAMIPPAAEDDGKVTLSLDKSLVLWSKFLIGLWTLFLVVGVMFYGYKLNEAYSKLSEAQLLTQQALVAAQGAQLETQKARNDARADAQETKILADDLQAKSRQVDLDMATLREKLKRVAGRDIDILSDQQQTGDNLVNLARSTQATQDSINRLEEKVASLAALVEPSLSPVASPAVFDDLSQSLGIQQVATPAPIESAPGGRQAYDLVFTACVWEDKQCTARDFKAIDKVIYRLDPRWFSAPEETRINPSDQFKLELRVWGSTKVTACIFLNGNDRPIVRSGRMDLHQTLKWGPETAAEPDDCKQADRAGN
jgi:hypothetical protein